MKLILGFAVAASIVMPIGVAFAADDAAYCKTLADTYRREARSRTEVDGGVPQAIAMCDTKPAEAIPTLIKVLQDRKVTVPPRT